MKTFKKVKLDCKPNELDGDLESTDNDSYGSNEEHDYGYAQHVSDDESEEENDGEGDIDEDGEGGWEDIRVVHDSHFCAIFTCLAC